MNCEKHPHCALPAGYVGDCPVCDLEAAPLPPTVARTTLKGSQMAIEYTDGRREFFKVLAVQEVWPGRFEVQVEGKS